MTRVSQDPIPRKPTSRKLPSPETQLQKSQSQAQKPPVLRKCRFRMKLLTETFLGKHEKSHIDECKKCRKWFRTRELPVHKRRSSKTPRFRCGMCDKPLQDGLKQREHEARPHLSCLTCYQCFLVDDVVQGSEEEEDRTSQDGMQMLQHLGRASIGEPITYEEAATISPPNGPADIFVICSMEQAEKLSPMRPSRSPILIPPTDSQQRMIIITALNKIETRSAVDVHDYKNRINKDLGEVASVTQMRPAKKESDLFRERRGGRGPPVNFLEIKGFKLNPFPPCLVSPPEYQTIMDYGKERSHCKDAAADRKVTSITRRRSSSLPPKALTISRTLIGMVLSLRYSTRRLMNCG